MSEEKPEMTIYELDSQWPVPKKTAFYTLGVVLVLAVFDFVDRQVMAALFPYLKAEYALSDTQLGMLVAVVNIAMAVLVLPTSYLVDRWSRKKMLAIMAAVWSLATGACAFAGSYSHLLMARLFIGAGEAGYHPAGQSLLAASFPKSWRTTVIGCMEGCMGLGAPIGLMLGTLIAERWGWRYAFGIVAIPGLIAAVCALFIKDFSTADVEKAAAKAAGKSNTRREPYLREVWSLLKRPSLVGCYLAMTASALMNGTLMSWLPSYFIREAEMTPSQGSAMGAIILLAISLGSFFIAPIWDRIRCINLNWANMGAAACQFIALGMMLIALMLLQPGSFLQISLMVLHCLFAFNLSAVTFSVVADLSLPHQRATAVGLAIFLLNLFGYSVGPLLTGFISDHFDLAHSLMVMTGFYAVSGLCMLFVSFFYFRDAAKIPRVTLTFE